MKPLMQGPEVCEDSLVGKLQSVTHLMC